MGAITSIKRKIIYPAALGLGVDSLLRALAPNRHINIMYHGVVKQSGTHFSPRHVLAEEFDRHLAYFKRNFDVISLREACEKSVSGKPFKRQTVSISFDDGFQNNLDNALPLLLKHQIPATFFISSICLEPMQLRCLVSEIVAALNYFHSGKTIEVDGHQFEASMELKTGKPISEFLSSSTPVEFEKRISQLIETYKLASHLSTLPREFWELMDAEGIQKLASAEGIEIGSHGRSHPNMALIPLEQVESEMRQSKEQLESLLGKKIDLFAYPYGAYTREAIDIGEKVGYTQQYAVKYRHSEDEQDPRILDRRGISAMTTFEANMLKLSRRFLSGD